MQAVNALPNSNKTVGNWIHKMFDDFEPQIIEELRTAKSRIHVSFDGWGSKHEKLSVVGVVVHFINSKGEAVTRLIGLAELPGHRKAGVGKSARLPYSCIYFFSAWCCRLRFRFRAYVEVSYPLISCLLL